MLASTLAYAEDTSSVFTSNKSMTLTASVTDTVGKAYTLTWSSPLSQYGSYLGTGNITGSDSNAGWKRIVYTNASGQTAYADPYSSGSITIKDGTAVTIQMVSGMDYSGDVLWVVGNSYFDYRSGNNCILVGSSYTPATSGTLSIYNDNYSDYGDYYGWGVKFS